MIYNKLLKPFISIVVPVYNKQAHIQRCINSILRQKFQDFEIIIVNDASNDGSIDEVKKYSDTRIKIFHNSQNIPKGPGSARNFGIEKSSGDWIAFLDADDEWNDIHLEMMVKLMSKFSECGFLTSGWVVSDGKNEIFNKYFKKNKILDSHTINLINFAEHYISGDLPAWTSVILVKNELAKNIFLEKGHKKGEDTYAWFKLMQKTHLGYSHHIGAIYYTNSDNKITKNFTSKPDYLRVYELKSVLECSSLDLNLIQKVLNRQIVDVFNSNISSYKASYRSIFDLAQKLYWKNDFMFTSFVLTKSLLKTFGYYFLMSKYNRS